MTVLSLDALLDLFVYIELVLNRLQRMRQEGTSLLIALMCPLAMAVS
jgi:hypothetical protein